MLNIPTDLSRMDGMATNLLSSLSYYHYNICHWCEHLIYLSSPVTSKADCIIQKNNNSIPSQKDVTDSKIGTFLC